MASTVMGDLDELLILVAVVVGMTGTEAAAAVVVAFGTDGIPVGALVISRSIMVPFKARSM